MSGHHYGACVRVRRKAPMLLEVPQPPCSHDNAIRLVPRIKLRGHNTQLAG